MGDEGTLPISARLYHYDKDIRAAAVRSLAGRADREALALLEGVFRADPDEAVRALALKAGQVVHRRIREQAEFERLLATMPPEDPFADVPAAPQSAPQSAPVLSRKLAAETAAPTLPPLPPRPAEPPINYTALWGGVLLYGVLMAAAMLISIEFSFQSPYMQSIVAGTGRGGRSALAFVQTFTRTLVIVGGIPLTIGMLWLENGIMHLLAVHAFNGWGNWRRLMAQTVRLHVYVAVAGLVVAIVSAPLSAGLPDSANILTIMSLLISVVMLVGFAPLFGDVISKLYGINFRRGAAVFAIVYGAWVLLSLANQIVNASSMALY